jgi:RHS repeat-associated protein
VELSNGGSYTQFVYGPGGGKLALMNGQTLQKAFVGPAVYSSTGLAFYRHSDWLGTSRFASTPSRTMYSSTAYAPYGEPYAQAGTTDLSFTGQNSDTAGGLYDFLAREYSTQGRWPSPDPAGLAAVSPGDPQSWNRYGYVRNSPSELTDPLGLAVKGDCDWGWGFLCWDDGCDISVGDCGGRDGHDWGIRIGLGGGVILGRGGSGSNGGNNQTQQGGGPGGPCDPSTGAGCSPGPPSSPCTINDDPVPCPTDNPALWAILTAGGLYTVVTVTAQPQPPAPRSASGGLLARAGVCASSYYGLDGSPLGVANAVKAVTLIPATPLPKPFLGLFGVRVTILGGEWLEQHLERARPRGWDGCAGDESAEGRR